MKESTRWKESKIKNNGIFAEGKLCAIDSQHLQKLEVAEMFRIFRKTEKENDFNKRYENALKNWKLFWI